jgi:dephospho-CoA kinase
MKDLYDFLVVVVSSQKNRLDRLAKNGLTAEQALSRMAKQTDDETRKNAADFLIVNDGNFEQLDSDVERIWQTLKERNFKS